MRHSEKGTSSVRFRKRGIKHCINSGLKFYKLLNYAKFGRNREGFDENTAKIDKVLALCGLENEILKICMDGRLKFCKTLNYTKLVEIVLDF